MSQTLRSTVLGRVSTGAGIIEELTGADTTALLDTFVASGITAQKGLVPSPGTTAGTTKFLREDATWALPSFTETDPQVGAVTTSKWCRGDGSAIQCDLDAPLAAEVGIPMPTT